MTLFGHAARFVYSFTLFGYDSRFVYDPLISVSLTVKRYTNIDTSRATANVKRKPGVISNVKIADKISSSFFDALCYNVSGLGCAGR